MSQRRVALSLSDRAAARLSRDRPWAQSQPNSSGNRNRPVLTSSSTQPQSTSIQMNRLALHSAPTRSTQSQSIPTSASSAKPQSTSIRMNRPALQPLTTARPAPSTVNFAKPKTVLERAQARSERLSAAKHADARHVADKPFSEIISEVRCLQARIAAYKAGKAERTAATSRQQVISPAVPIRSQRRPRAPSPMTILIDSLDYRGLPAARSAPAPHPSPLPSPAPSPPRLVAPSAFKAPRFHGVRAHAIDFPAFPKPKDPPSQLKGILRKASRRYKPNCKGDRCCSQYSSAKKKVAFDMNDEVHEHEKWIGICQGTESDAQKFTDCGQPISGRGLHVYPDLTRFLGQLRGWLPVPGDNYNYTYFRGVNWRDHSDCPRGLRGRGCERGRRHRRFEALCPNYYGNVDLATLKNIEKECGPPGDEFSTERFRDNTP